MQTPHLARHRPSHPRRQIHVAYLFGWAFGCLLISLPALGVSSTPEPNDPPPQETDATSQSIAPQRISMSLRDADLVEVLRNFARIGNFNLILDPAVRGKVTVELRDVPWDKALEQILKVQGLGIDVVGGHRLIGSPTAVSRQRDQLLAVRRIELRLQHLDAARVAAVLSRPGSGLLSPLGSAQASEGGGLALKDTGLQLMELGPLLQKLDRPEMAQKDFEALASRADLVWAQSQVTP